jgi:hypothetical protein
MKYRADQAVVGSWYVYRVSDDRVMARELPRHLAKMIAAALNNYAKRKLTTNVPLTRGSLTR